MVWDWGAAVKETIEWYADMVLAAAGQPQAAIAKLARERDDYLLLEGYKGATDLGDGCRSKLWLPEDQEGAWWTHITSARKWVKNIAAI